MMNNNENNLDEMMKLASVDSEYHNPKRNIKMPIVITIITIIILVAIALSLKGKKQEVLIAEEVPIKTQSNKPSPVTKVKNVKTPDMGPSWANKPVESYDISTDNSMRSEIIKSAKDIQNFSISVGWMPSGIKGNWENAPSAYTNDLSKQYIGDEINPYFSYVLKEDYEIAYMSYIQRLLNPIYGNWANAQISDENNEVRNLSQLEILKEIFSEDWWENNITKPGDYKNLPIVSDWEDDNFGGLELATNREYPAVFFGVINESKEMDGLHVQANNVGQDSLGHPIIEINTPVKYVAVSKDKKDIIINGNLTLQLSANADSQDIRNRVVIIKSELILEPTSIK